MKVYVSSDDTPFLFARVVQTEMYDIQIELSDAEWADYKRVQIEYLAWQSRLRAALEGKSE